MTPDQLGYAKCARCGCLRPVAELHVQEGFAYGVYRVCNDGAVCAALTPRVYMPVPPEGLP